MSIENLPPPLPHRLRRLLKDYGMYRWQAARALGIALVTFHRYTLPEASRHHHPMPQWRWRALVDHLKTTRHPDFEVHFNN